MAATSILSEKSSKFAELTATFKNQHTKLKKQHTRLKESTRSFKNQNIQAMNRKLILSSAIALASLTASAQSSVKAPAPILPLPEQKQIDWQP